jgi:hypothetical protein
VHYTGFIAQDVEAAAKKLNYDFSGVYHPQNDKDLYGLSYADFVVPLVRSVQELVQQNDSLKSENSSLRKDLNDLNALVLQIQPQQQCGPCSNSNISSANNVQQYKATLTNAASIEQNIPNPFTNTTTISYSIPQQFSSAKIIVTDKNGNALKQINLSSNKGSINVDASILSSGAYQYSLYVNGRLIDSKQMILAK